MLRNPDEAQALLEPTDEEITAQFNGEIIDNFTVANPDAKQIAPARINEITLAAKQLHDQILLQRKEGAISARDAYTVATATRAYAKNAASAQSDEQALSYKQQYLATIDPIINKYQSLRPLAIGVITAGFAVALGAGLPIAIGMGTAHALLDKFGFWSKLNSFTRAIVPQRLTEAERRNQGELSGEIARNSRTQRETARR